MLKVAFFVLAVILLSFGYAALAGDTESGALVSCSIPAVPGLNAPPIDREK